MCERTLREAGKVHKMTTLEMVKERLTQGVLALEALDRKRLELDSPMFGYDVECLIIAQEIRELEQDIEADPGGLEPYLVRVRRSHF